MAEMGIFETIYSTRAMRRLKPDPIPEDTLKKIVDAGIHAPSGGNEQTWGFLLVRDPALKRFIRDHYWQTLQRLRGGSTLPADAPPSWLRMMTAVAHLAEHIHEAPVILLACAPQEFAPLAKAGSSRASVATIHGSIYPAVQNILLACRALGVGATLTTLHGFFEEELKQQLDIPAHLEIAALIPLGFPQGNFGPTKRRPVDEVIHWDRWGKGKK